MSLFNTFCENYLEEMSAPKRGTVGIPKSPIKTPSFVGRAKVTQAGKYTGAEMLTFLGEFLTDNGDRTLDYSEIQKLLDTFLKRKGFGGTAAKYWTRTLGQAIYDFGYQPEKPSEITDGKGEQPEEFEADEVPQIVDSEEVSGGGEGEDEEPTAEEPKPPASQEAEEEDVLEDYWTKKVYEYIKDGGETPTSEEDVSGYIQKRAAQVRDSEAENEEFVVRKIKILVSKGLLKKEGEGYVAVEKEIEQKEGEGTGEVDTFDREGDERDYGAEDTIAKYASQWGERPEFGSQYENFDMMKAFSEIFKSNSRE
jgi:hypothetical protein